MVMDSTDLMWNDLTHCMTSVPNDVIKCLVGIRLLKATCDDYLCIDDGDWFIGIYVSRGSMRKHDVLNIFTKLLPTHPIRIFYFPHPSLPDVVSTTHAPEHGRGTIQQNEALYNRTSRARLQLLDLPNILSVTTDAHTPLGALEVTVAHKSVRTITTNVIPQRVFDDDGQSIPVYIVEGSCFE